MSDVSAIVRLTNGFTPVLNNMINSLSLVVSSIDSVGRSMNNVDTSGFDAARNAVEQLENSAQSLQGVMSGLSRLPAPRVLPPDTSGFQWQSYGAPDFFTNTGAERFASEVNSINAKLQSVLSSQNQITNTALHTNIIDPDAYMDIRHLEERLNALSVQIDQFENNPLNIGTSSAINALEQLRLNAVSDIAQIQSEMQSALQIGDLESLHQGYSRIHEIISNTQRQIRDLNATPIAIKWRNDNFQIFTNTGVERFNSEVADANSRMQRLTETQSRITELASNSNILSPDAIADISNVETRMSELFSMIRANNSAALNIDVNLANANAERTREQLAALGTEYQNALNLALQGGDMSQVNAAFQQIMSSLNGMTQQARDFRDTLSQTAAYTWQTDNLQVFTNTGIGRFKAEIRDASSLMNTLQEAQQRVQAQAAHCDLLPNQATTDLVNVGKRLNNVQSIIQRISANPAKFADRYSADQIEQIRGQLNATTGIMNRINELMRSENVDVAQINQLVLQLSGNTGAIERQLRQNTSAQNRFNSSVKSGHGLMTGLGNTLRSMLSMYMGYAGIMKAVQGVKSALNLSDTLTSTTARLNMMTGDLQKTKQLQDEIFQSAQRSRASYETTADVVAKLGLRAKDAFSSNAEVVQFSENLNKLFRISGTSQQEISSASLQLTQALGSGVLRGEEFRAVFEAAPNIMQTIAESIGKPVGALKDLASDGQITADVVKNALLGATEQINKKFDSMPMTFEQTWQSFQNTALMAFQPVLDKLSALADSTTMSSFINNLSESVTNIANTVNENWAGIEAVINGFMGAVSGIVQVLGFVIELITGAAAAFSNNWGNIAPVLSNVALAFGLVSSAILIFKVAVSAAKIVQGAFNAKLFGCPLVWIAAAVLAVVAVVGALVGIINKATGESYSLSGVLGGLLGGALAFVGNLVMSLWNIVATAVVFVWNIVADLANFLGEVFKNPLAAVGRLFFNLFDSVLGIIEGVAGAIGNLFGQDWSSGINDFREKMNAIKNIALGPGEEVVKKLDPNDLSVKELFGIDYINYADAWNNGYQFGDNLFNSSDNPFNANTQDLYNDNALSTLGGYLSNISDNTDNISDSVSISEENLKYLRDTAEREAINRYTFSSINIDMSGMNNTINNREDIDGFFDEFTEAVETAAANMAQGVHS